jgi:hypothetical protein
MGSISRLLQATSPLLSPAPTSVHPTWSSEMTLLDIVAPLSASQFQPSPLHERASQLHEQIHVATAPLVFGYGFTEKKNVCSLGYKTKRHGTFLAALYAVHSGYWLFIPVLIWDQMHKCWEGLIAKRIKAAETWSPPFPFLITQLLHPKGVAFLDEDFSIIDFLKFDL